uniref:Ubiquitin-like domain-containing protein n=1 Tax=Lessardia elongata TaxID=210733 RepID=A0A7S2QWN0_9DINO
MLLFVTNVKTAKTVWVEISINDNIELLKKYISRKMLMEEKVMVLIYMGEELRNEFKIKDCRLKDVIQKVAEGQDPHPDECTVHLIDLRDTPTELREPKSD